MASSESAGFSVPLLLTVALFNKAFLAGAFIHGPQKLQCVILMGRRL